MGVLIFAAGSPTMTIALSRDHRLEPGNEQGSLITLKGGNPQRHFVRSLNDFPSSRTDSSSKIADHSSGERRSFNASLSGFSCVEEPLEDVGDIVNPIVVRFT